MKMSYVNFFLMNALYYYTRITTFYAEFLNRITSKPPPLVVYKVVRYFGIDGEEDVTDRYTSGQDISIPENNESSNESSNESIEYRFTWKRDKKYRVVRTGPDDPGPLHDALAKAAVIGTFLGPKIVMAALVNPDENIEAHVLDRVCKFAGPQHDFFHNKHLQMKHMFHNDDMLPGTVLKILWSNGSLLSYDQETTLI
jgi:hypothetical protein